MALKKLDLDILDPGVRNMVSWLRLNEFDTTDSGDGVSKSKNDMEGVLDVPHVIIGSLHSVDSLQNEALRLWNLLRKYIVVEPGMIQASYDPADNSYVLSLTDHDDSFIRKWEG